MVADCPLAKNPRLGLLPLQPGLAPLLATPVLAVLVLMDAVLAAPGLAAPVLATPALVTGADVERRAAPSTARAPGPTVTSGLPAARLHPATTVAPAATLHPAAPVHPAAAHAAGATVLPTPTQQLAAQGATPTPTLAQSADPPSTAAPGSGPGPTPAIRPAAPTPSPWASTLELYGFLPLRTQADLEIGNRSTSFDVGLGTLLSKLKWASSARGSLEYGRLGLLGDVRYDRLGSINSRTGPRGLVGVKAATAFNATVADLALRYRFGAREAAQGKAGEFSIIPYAGVRIIDANFGVTTTINVLRFERQVSRELRHTWVQALLGTQATVFLAPRLRLFGRADVGAFGSGGDSQGEAEKLTGNAQVGLGYALGRNTDLNLSWRYSGLNWNNGLSGRSYRGLSSDENGVEIGLKFFF